MSVKFSTLILKVDLSCCKCNRKIKKLLCKIQDRENIRLIAYDDKNNTVTISGPFDPQYLKRKLYCKACKIIKDIQIPPPPPPEKKPDPPPPEKKPNPPPPEKKPDPPPPEKKPNPPPEKKPDPPPEKKPDPPPEKKPDPPPEKKPDPPPEKKPDPPPEKKPDPPPEKKPDPPPEKKPDPPPEKKPDPPPEKKPEKKPDPPKSVWPPGLVCCNQPCYVGMFGGLKCASCGMVYTWTNQGPPPVMVYNQPPVPRPSYYDGYSYGYGHGCACGCGQPKTCQFIYEDNTSQCTIM